MLLRPTSLLLGVAFVQCYNCDPNNWLIDKSLELSGARQAQRERERTRIEWRGAAMGELRQLRVMERVAVFKACRGQD
jgi:hypothetical protein